MAKDEYQAALDYVLSFADYERISRSAVVFDLSRVEALLERLGQPQLAAKSVHIAGTKGKGSTAAMIASVLTASGYRTGLYTSPHLHTMRERIQVNGKPIAENELVGLVEKLKSDIHAINRLGTMGELTTFEILTAMAFVYFKENNVDFQVLETGLGGRLDATNVIRPAVCAITSISLDHTEVLGATLTEIATEKAGIIKPDVAVVCAPQPPEASAVIERVCLERGAALIKVGKDVTWQIKDRSYASQSFRLKGLRDEYDLIIPLLGDHQLDNAAVAVACLEVLADSEAGITPVTISNGMSKVNWPGRLEVLRHNPLFVLDCAHNADSAMKLRQSIERYFEFNDLLLIVGTSKEKDLVGIVAELARLPARIIVTRSDNPRAASTSVLVAEFSEWGVVPLVSESVASAVELALTEAKPTDLVCATGSLFVVAEVSAYLKGVDREQYST